MSERDDLMAQFQRSARMLDLYFCKRCGAMVQHDFLELHDRWHRRMEEAGADMGQIAELLDMPESVGRQEWANRTMEACRLAARAAKTLTD